MPRFALWHSVEIGNVALLVAALDLKVVQLVRSAINSNLPKTGPLGTIPVGANLATRPSLGANHTRNTIHPDPRIEPRKVIHPTPRYEARQVFHPDPVYRDKPPPFIVKIEESDPWAHKNPLQPLWKTPFWNQPLPIEQTETKVHVIRVDRKDKGQLLDLFV